MGANDHPTTKVIEEKDMTEESNNWLVDIQFNGSIRKSAFEVSGPKRIQALQQAWQELEDRKEEFGVEDLEFGTIGLTVRKP
jgi:hypothetical protein